MTQPFVPSVEAPSDALSPLIRFRGKLKEYVTNSVVPEGETRARMSVTFNFIEVTVIESREPYVFPIAEIRVPYSDRGATRWAALTASFRNLVPRDVYGSDPLAVLVDRELEMYYGPAKLRMPMRDDEGNQIEPIKWAEQWGEAWQFVSVEGFSKEESGNITDLVVDYSDGKKDSDIYQWIYTDQSLKKVPGYEATVEAVGNRALLSTLVSAGKLTVNADGIYHKVG